MNETITIDGGSMSLNEQLAVEICGALKGGLVEYSLATGVPRRRATYAIKGQIIDQSDWNPTTDLNQLRICYEALSEYEKKRFKQKAWGSFMGIENIFTNPELVAQAILQAKGVS